RRPRDRARVGPYRCRRGPRLRGAALRGRARRRRDPQPPGGASGTRSPRAPAAPLSVAGLRRGGRAAAGDQQGRDRGGTGRRSRQRAAGHAAGRAGRGLAGGGRMTGAPVPGTLRTQMAISGETELVQEIERLREELARREREAADKELQLERYAADLRE